MVIGNSSVVQEGIDGSVSVSKGPYFTTLSTLFQFIQGTLFFPCLQQILVNTNTLWFTIIKHEYY